MKLNVPNNPTKKNGLKSNHSNSKPYNNSLKGKEESLSRLSEPELNHKDYYIDPTLEYVPPKPLIQVKQEEIYFRLLNQGEISLIKGKQKSRKTTFCKLLVASVISEKNVFQPLFRKGRARNILYIDTEQSKSDVHKLTKDVSKLVDVSPRELKKNIHFFSLRRYIYSQRTEIIGKILKYKVNNYELLIIDGIRDLIGNINDSEQSQNLIEKLLRWSDDYNLHILSVLHENKSNPNSRGHIGSELDNKSEIIMKIKNQGKYSVITCEHSRGIPFNKIGLKMNDENLPEFITTDDLYTYQKSSKQNNKKSLSSEEITKALHQISKEINGITHTACWKMIKKQLNKSGVELGNNIAKLEVTKLIEKGVLINKGSKKRMRLYLDMEKFNKI